jgi:hypothetical protein
VNVAVGEELRSLKTVPVNTATLEPALLTATSTLPTKSLTGFPETSRTEITGWLAMLVLLTAVVDELTTTNWVATPWASSIALVPVRLLGSKIVAVRVLAPAAPVRTKSLKVAIPELADLVVVPEIVAPVAVRTIDWFAAVPVVTRFWSASWISAATEESKVRAFEAVVAPVRTTALTAP